MPNSIPISLCKGILTNANLALSASMSYSSVPAQLQHAWNRCGGLQLAPANSYAGYEDGIQMNECAVMQCHRMLALGLPMITSSMDTITRYGRYAAAPLCAVRDTHAAYQRMQPLDSRHLQQIKRIVCQQAYWKGLGADIERPDQA